MKNLRYSIHALIALSAVLPLNARADAKSNPHESHEGGTNGADKSLSGYSVDGESSARLTVGMILEARNTCFVRMAQAVHEQLLTLQKHPVRNLKFDPNSTELEEGKISSNKIDFSDQSQKDWEGGMQGLSFHVPSNPQAAAFLGSNGGEWATHLGLGLDYKTWVPNPKYEENPQREWKTIRPPEAVNAAVARLNAISEFKKVRLNFLAVDVSSVTPGLRKMMDGKVVLTPQRGYTTTLNQEDTSFHSEGDHSAPNTMNIWMFAGRALSLAGLPIPVVFKDLVGTGLPMPFIEIDSLRKAYGDDWYSNGKFNVSKFIPEGVKVVFPQDNRGAVVPVMMRYDSGPHTIGLRLFHPFKEGVIKVDRQAYADCLRREIQIAPYKR